jgi:hypothetical protein
MGDGAMAVRPCCDEGVLAEAGLGDVGDIGAEVKIAAGGTFHPL